MENKEPTIEERHAALAQHVTDLTIIIDRLEGMMQKTDKRISRLYSITLRIGADFAERLRKLEQDDPDDEDDEG